MNFAERITTLIENTEQAWNESNFEAITALLESDVVSTIEPITIGHISIKATQLIVREEVKPKTV